MGTLRAYLLKRFRLAMVLVVLTLVVKAVVPTGYMVGTQGKALTILVCGDVSGDHLTKQIAIPGKAEGQAKTSEACPYASLSFASLDAGLPVFVALAMAFLLLLGFAPARVPILAGLSHVRPPLRGPPALI